MDQEVVLRITDLARGGAGVSRESNGRVVFVPFSAPGDLVKVRITEQNKRYAQAEILEVIEPSSMRQQPKCPAFGKCGGCQWQHLPYDIQWKTKSEGVRHALNRVQVELPNQFDEIPTNQIWEYRNRIQLRGEGRKIGFFKSGSRDLIPVDRCDIARSELNQVWTETQEEGARLPRGFKVELEVFPNGDVRKTWNSAHSAGGFRQVHDAQNERLKKWIFDALSPREKLYDLFGGSGNLCLSLESKMAEIHCVDLTVPRTRPSGIGAGIHFHRSDVMNWLVRQARQVKENQQVMPPSVAILDPPREGLAEQFSEIASAVETLGVQDLIAVGCDPDSWARDVSRWKKRGWSLKRVMVIDLFPQTAHIESVGLLTRSS